MKLLLGIFLLALFLRLYNLGNIPVGIHGDEASIGYNAYSLLQTGKDQNGNFLPLVIDQFGDFRPAGYHYLDIPFVAALGLNEWAIRLPSAIFGALTIFVLYLLTQAIFKTRSISVISAFFLAVSPWHIAISRATSEGIVAAFFLITGMYFLLKYRQNQKESRNLLVSFICLFISFLFYHAARIFIPLYLVFFLFYVFIRKESSVTYKKNILIFFCILVASLVMILKLTSGIARPSSVSIFNIPGGDTQITQQIGEDGNQIPFITRVFHNKALFYSRIFSSTYFQHLNGGFLFGSFGKPLRYDVPWSSVLYIIDLPFLVFGFCILIADGIRKKKYSFLLVIMWVVLGALPAGLTYEDLPNVQRASLMIPALVMICAFGVYEFFHMFNGKKSVVLWIAYIGTFSYCVLLFFHNYFYHLSRHEPWHRSAAQKELILLVNDYEKKYKHVVMTTEGNNNFIFYLLYTKYDPAVFQKKGSPKEINGLEFENVTYYYQKCPLGVDSDNPVSEDPEIVFVNKADCKVPINTQLLNTIRHPDGTPAYLILKVDPYWKPKQS